MPRLIRNIHSVTVEFVSVLLKILKTFARGYVQKIIQIQRRRNKLRFLFFFFFLEFRDYFADEYLIFLRSVAHWSETSFVIRDNYFAPFKRPSFFHNVLPRLSRYSRFENLGPFAVLFRFYSDFIPWIKKEGWDESFHDVSWLRWFITSRHREQLNR